MIGKEYIIAYSDKFETIVIEWDIKRELYKAVCFIASDDYLEYGKEAYESRARSSAVKIWFDCFDDVELYGHILGDYYQERKIVTKWEEVLKELYGY